jgi:hypothetical protein
LLVPNATWYEVAPVDAAQVTDVDIAIPVTALAGDGPAGAAGGAATVVNDHRGPTVAPPGPLAVMRQ